MKKIMYLAAALLVLVGCNKNSQENKENAPANYGTITGKIELPKGPNKIAAPDGWKAKTEAFKMQWESTDKIYIYNQSECKELTVESIDAQTGNATFAGELLTDMTSYNVAYGYNPTAGATAFAVDYIAENYRPFAWGTGEYKIFTIDNFGPVMGLKLKGTAKVKKIEVVALKGDAAQATYTMTLGTAIELNTETPTTVYFPLNDLGDADKLEAKFYRGSNAFKTQAFVTLPAKNIVTTYPIIEADPSYNGHEYVDLGLPSGIMWATCNVGATAPEGCGDYFAWGETAPYYNTPIADPLTWKTDKETGYNWQSYCGQSSFSEWDPAPYDDNKILLLTKDAAHVNWEGDWRMPTKAEFEELKTKCTWTWTTLNSISGYKVEGPNKNTIFLPATGIYSGSSVSKSSFGYYYSSSLNKENSVRADDFLFSSSDDVRLGTCDRYIGLSVRPVVD